MQRWFRRQRVTRTQGCPSRTLAKCESGWLAYAKAGRMGPGSHSDRAVATGWWRSYGRPAMTHVSVRTHIAAPRDVVFADAADHETFLRSSDGATTARIVTPGRPAPN